MPAAQGRVQGSGTELAEWGSGGGCGLRSGLPRPLCWERGAGSSHSPTAWASLSLSWTIRPMAWTSPVRWHCLGLPGPQLCPSRPKAYHPADAPSERRSSCAIQSLKAQCLFFVPRNSSPCLAGGHLSSTASSYVSLSHPPTRCQEDVSPSGTLRRQHPHLLFCQL